MKFEQETAAVAVTVSTELITAVVAGKIICREN
jgi:hypothetical protein